MRGSTHLIAGLLMGALIAPDAAVIAAAGVGALLPDIDHPNSVISRWAGLVAAPIRWFVSHRGLLHSGAAAALVVLLALLVPAPWTLYALAAATGYNSHIALHALTVAGIPFFWPSRTRISLLPIRTGGLIEACLAILLCGLLVLRGLIYAA